MTAEIVLMNRSGISLAADSAITTGFMSVQKKFTSANKIFTLSKYNPIGIMFYNLATFMNAPWELLIKNYRSKLGEMSFPTVDDAALDFIEFLKKYPIPEELQNELVAGNVSRYFETTRNVVTELLRKEYGEQINNISLTKTEIDPILFKYLTDESNYFEVLPNTSFSSDITLGDFISTFNEVIAKCVSKYVAEFDSFNDSQKQIFYEISYKIFSKRFSDNYSGIVITGFGDEEIFPSLRSYIIAGKVMDKLIISDHLHDNIDITNGKSARIYSFAQDNMAQIFTCGIDKQYKNDLLNIHPNILRKHLSCLYTWLSDILPDDLKSKLTTKFNELETNYLHEFNKYISEYEGMTFLSPLLGIISIMPKDELAQLAESLVSVTSLRMKVSLNNETVGGPTDVAVISKGDGFIWIKRKHYFSPELNSGFFMNYNRQPKQKDI